MEMSFNRGDNMLLGFDSLVLYIHIYIYKYFFKFIFGCSGSLLLRLDFL